jgi:peptidyl-tRNA hydrolase, PTH1 family
MAGVPLKLIVGLGNPGREYAQTRHNAGWWFVDQLAAQYRAAWKHAARDHTELAKIRLGDNELWLLKPVSFMNNSGGPTAAVAGFYRIPPAEMLVVHDEIDLPPGVARLKQGGGHGGHNGVRDVIAHLGAEFWRLRLGVGHPGSKELVIGSVLDRPTAAEQRSIEDAMTRSLQVLPDMLGTSAQKAMHALRTAND